MKPLKVTRKITIAVRELLDALLSERWFELRIEDRDFNPYDENVNIITTFNIRDLEDELINCSESESELQDTLNKMYSIWTTYYNKERNLIAFGDTDELFSTWKDKYNGEIAQDAIVIIIRLRNVISAINVILTGLAQTHGLKLTEERPTPPTNKPQSTFRGIIQYHDPDKLLERLHFLIDGKSGKAVGMVIRKAWIDRLITGFPTMSEFESEFEIICTNSEKKKSKWESIRKYFDRENVNYDIDANDIEILN